jgi:hypothetical protein
MNLRREGYPLGPGLLKSVLYEDFPAKVLSRNELFVKSSSYWTYPLFFHAFSRGSSQSTEPELVISKVLIALDLPQCSVVFLAISPQSHDNKRFFAKVLKNKGLA